LNYKENGQFGYKKKHAYNSCCLQLKMTLRSLIVIVTILLTSCSSKTVRQLLDDGFQEDGKKAIRLYSKAISKDKNNVEAYWRRGGEYYKMKRYSNAIADFNKAISIDSAYNEGYLFGDRGLCKEAAANYPEAIEDYTTAVKLCKTTEPSTPRENFYFYRARTRIKNGDTTLAMSDVDTALYYWSSFPRARYMKGRLLVMQGQYNEAEKYFNSSLDPSSASDKEFIDDVFYYGLLKFKTGDSLYCRYWNAAAKYNYPLATEYIAKYCK
jgi:tetratricopeptide (TPR) repeat protein